MGSDLHMSPPSPDEQRIVRAGSWTAVYSRHTDRIYRGGTETWERKVCVEDPDGLALRTLKETHPGYRVTTLDENRHVDGMMLPVTAPLDYIGEPDRDWAGEEKRLKAAYQYALRDLTRAREAVAEKEQAYDDFLRERETAGE